MMSRYKKILAVAMGVGMTAAVGIPSAYAARPNTLPAGTVVTGNLKSGTKMTFDGNIDGVAITVKCTTFTTSGKVPAKASDTVTLTGAPTIKGCTDDIGGKDTIKTNTTNGKWKLSVTKTSPYTMTLTMPKAGATFTSSVLSSCVITAAPTKADAIPGSYNGTSTDTVTNGSIPTSGSGCTSTTATTSATVVLSPAPGAPPF
jgi:hypothetical protein